MIQKYSKKDIDISKIRYDLLLYLKIKFCFSGSFARSGSANFVIV